MRTGGCCQTVDREISRFPRKERLHMPGSLTTPGRPNARDDAPRRVAFHDLHGVGTQNRKLSRLNGWPMRSPVNASLRPSRATAHDSGPMWIATPSSQGTCTSTPCRSPGASQMFSALPSTTEIKATYVSLVPIGRLVTFDNQPVRPFRPPKWVFLLKKVNFLPMNRAHRSAAIVPQRFDHPHHGLERTHSLTVIGASGQNQISMLATQCLHLTQIVLQNSQNAMRQFSRKLD